MSASTHRLCQREGAIFLDVLVILGSRNPEGQTARAAAACLEGIEAAGGRGELLFLPAMHLERCRQCGADGWGTCLPEGRCQVADDFAPLVDRLQRAEAAILPYTMCMPMMWLRPF